MEFKYLVVLVVFISPTFVASIPIKSLNLKADKSIIEGLECGAHQKVMEGEQFYFRSRPSSRIPRSSVPVPLSYWFPQPQQHPQSRYPPFNPFPQNSFHNAFSVDVPPRTGFGQTYIKPRVCKWTFEANGNCQLVANFDHYENGDLNCHRQYLLFGDDDRDVQVCGYAPFPGHFKSTGNSLYIKHYRKPGTWGADFEGFVSCIKRRYEPEIVEYGPVSGEVVVKKEEKIKEFDSFADAELADFEADDNVITVVDDNGLEPAIEITEVKEELVYPSPTDDVAEAEVVTDEKQEENAEVNGIEPRDEEESADVGNTVPEDYIKPVSPDSEYKSDEPTPEEQPLYPTKNNYVPQEDEEYNPTPSTSESESQTADKGTQTYASPEQIDDEVENYPTQAPLIYEATTETYKPEESEQHPPEYKPEDKGTEEPEQSPPEYKPEYKGTEESEQYPATQNPEYIPKPAEESEQYPATQNPEYIPKPAEEYVPSSTSNPEYKQAEESEQPETENSANSPDAEPKKLAEEPTPSSEYQAPDSAVVKDQPKDIEYAEPKYKPEES